MSSDDWEDHQAVKIPGGGRAEAVAAPLTSVLGWLVALGSSADDDTLGVSATWLGLVAAVAVRLVAQGRMVPQLKRGRGARNDSDGQPSSFSVRWMPTLIDPTEFAGLSESRPGAINAFGNRQDAPAFTRAVIADLLDAICRNAALRLEVPAAPPEPKTRADVGEALLAHLDGSPFDAPGRVGADLGRRLTQWAGPALGEAGITLVLQLDPPDDVDAWHLAVLAPNENDALEPVEAALVNSSKARRKDVRDELTRLERLYPELLRGGQSRRAEVILSQDEAWKLMTETGEMLSVAGFDIRVPELSRRKPTPTLRLTALDAQESVVGAQQLANVSWTAMFDDIELTAADVVRLAAEARPLVRSRGQWVELDHADLAEAAAALAERANDTQLTGADMLRHALGLEGAALGGISIAGEGWAADLLHAASNVPDVSTTPVGFEGELRSYQANALAWLGFLDGAGLGGCLALDMGLGKTPTMLANLATTTKEHGPALVVAPPAVVGNWAAEAARFTPGVKVAVHHGANRAKGAKLTALARKTDVIITTYGTAVRDAEQLSKMEWSKVVLDEAQAVKNPSSETAQQLQRITARTRIALTGTPIENGLADLWAIMDYCNPGLVGAKSQFVAHLTPSEAKPGDKKEQSESALRALNGILVFRRTKAEPAIAAELPDRIDELDHCAMTPEQIGLYQAVLDALVVETADSDNTPERKGAVLAAITALKQICNHPVNYQSDDKPLDGRSGKLARLNEIVDTVFASDERMLIFTHFATWGTRLASYLTERNGLEVPCYHGGLARGARDRMIEEFQNGEGKGAMVLSLKAGGTGLNLTAANHVVLYDRWWNPAVEDQARDRVWRIGQDKTVICHRLVCPGTVDDRVEEVVAGKRQIANMVLPKSSSVGDLDAEQLQRALGIDPENLLTDDDDPAGDELTEAMVHA